MLLPGCVLLWLDDAGNIGLRSLVNWAKDVVQFPRIVLVTALPLIRYSAALFSYSVWKASKMPDPFNNVLMLPKNSS